MDIDSINKFNSDIEDLVYMKDISYMDAILEYCESNRFEVELVGKLISGVTKSKLQDEAEKLHFIKKSKTKQLPI